MIASWSPRRAEAAKYISYATSSKIMHKFVANQGQPARSSALNDPENVKVGKYFPTLQKVLAQGHPFPAIPRILSVPGGARKSRRRNSHKADNAG